MTQLQVWPALLAANPALTRLPAQVKIVALVGFVLAVVATPQQVFWPYAGQLGLLLVLVAWARLPPSRLLRGLAVEVPFLLFAVAMPFVATGPRVEVFGLRLSQPGLWGAWALVAKGTLGVLAATVLAATTTPEQFLDGLRRLRVPGQLVEIMGFMIRYLGLSVDQWGRMAAARASRGFEAKGPRDWLVLSRGLGTLFIRSYERGERVQLAMLARGYTGTVPDAVAVPVRARPRHWWAAAVLPAAALAISLAARGLP